MLTLSPRPHAGRLPQKKKHSSVAPESDSFAEPPDANDWRLPDDEPDEPSDMDEPAEPEIDDDRWDVFLPDDDPYGPRPEPGDFWVDAEEE